MTVQALALQLGRDLGITTLDPAENVSNTNQRGVTTQDKLALLLAINGALQEIFKDGPSSVSESHTGDIIRVPAAVTLTASQFSATISGLTTYAAWMVGCTIRIAGDSDDNEIVSQTTLARPFLGSTGATTGTVYADAIPLDSTISHILGNVRIQGLPGLCVVGTREEFDRSMGVTDYGSGEYGGDASTSVTVDDNKQIGDPSVGFVDTRYRSTLNVQPKFLRFNRLPVVARPLRFRAKLTPPLYTVDNIGTDITVEPDVSLAIDNAESILYAIARKRISGDPLFGALDALPEIDRQYRHAIAQLGSSQPYVGPRKASYE